MVKKELELKSRAYWFLFSIPVILAIILGAIWNSLLVWAKLTFFIFISFVAIEINYYCLMVSARINKSDFDYKDAKITSLICGFTISFFSMVIGFMVVERTGVFVNLLLFCFSVVFGFLIVALWFVLNKQWAIKLLGRKKVVKKKQRGYF
jgi:hypothetical protein